MKTNAFLAITFVGLLSVTPFILGCGSGDGRPGMFSEMGYHVGKEKVWLKSPGSAGVPYEIREVVGADPKTFQTVVLKNSAGATQTIGRDSKNAYWGSEPFPEADIKTLAFFDRAYFRDSRTIFHFNEPISNDAANAQMVGLYLKDGRSVFFGGQRISDDAANFKQPFPKNENYYSDSSRVWFDISLIKGADPQTLQHLGFDFSKDSNSVFHEMNKIDGADPATFVPIDDRFSRDSKNCFYLSMTLENSDPKSLVVVNKEIAKDNKVVFYLGFPLPDADPATFEAIDEFYVKDSKRVWINGKVIQGADPKTFKIIDSKAGRSRDAKHTYDLDRQI